VFKSANHIYAQIVDDSQGQTLAAASSQKLGDVKPEDKAGRKIAIAREVGKKIAEAAKQSGIQRVSFDRGGYRYHGRLAALADGARSNGLEF
jgi:large subunit ribosomal protein L18